MLTAYGGTSIGNPLKWRNASSMVWVARQLDTHNFTNGDAVYYDYNSDGIRTRKLYWSDLYYTFRSHDYILDGTKIIQETVDDGITGQDYTLYYFYDESGVAGFEYNGVNYYFVKNIQGDVIEICNWDNGTVVQYTYDAWGKVLSVTGSLASTVGQYNPFRYRSYYYDTETGFYYLNSRYYDPQVCRFISPDTVAILAASTLSLYAKNLFVYCDNNPVMRADSSGAWWHVVAGAVVGAVVSSIFSCIEQKTEDDEIKPMEVFADALVGAVCGAAAAGGMPLLAACVETVYEGGKTLVDEINENNDDKPENDSSAGQIAANVFIDAGLTFAFSYVPGADAQQEAFSMATKYSLRRQALAEVQNYGNKQMKKEASKAIANYNIGTIARYAGTEFLGSSAVTVISGGTKWYVKKIVELVYFQ